MKKRGYILIIIFLILLAVAVSSGQQEAEGAKRLITAQDLLEEKGLTAFKPPCTIGKGSSSLKTAVDLLREKGLLGEKTSNGKGAKEEEDVWGLGQDFGC